jgi:integrase
MGSLIRQQITVYLDSEGRRVKKSTPGARKVRQKTSKWYGQYLDASNRRRRVPLSTDKVAARHMLAALEREAELVRRGVMSKAEASVSKHQATPLDKHFEDYVAYLEANGACKEHRSERGRQLRRIAKDCSFSWLADLDRTALERWLTQQVRNGMSARTRNSYLASCLAFCNWCADEEVGRLLVNPFDGIEKANEKGDRRRQRRSLTEEELVKLLSVARERPLLEALTVRKGPRKGERYADVRPDVQERLSLLGRERSLIYKTLVLTGLRKGELASLTVARLYLDPPDPYVAIGAADEKNGEGSSIPLRDDLAADLRNWLAQKLQRLQDEARLRARPVPMRLPPETPLFDVPAKLCKILARDLVAAGIAKRVEVNGKVRIDKRDDRGRTVDVHALRHTFGTFMSKGGVTPRTAQAAMRHSKIELTMNVYTDPRLLDVRGALDVLPSLPLDEAPAVPTPFANTADKTTSPHERSNASPRKGRL